MLATAVLSVFGFFFWILVARLFSTPQIGVATALISVMSLISYLSLIGFNVAFVRFLPNSPSANAKMNTGMLLVAAAAIVFSLGFVGLVRMLAPELAFIQNPLLSAAFALFCVTSALNILTEAIFLAGRKTGYTLFNNTAFSVVKLLLPVFFIPLGALGIFFAAAFSQVAGFVINLYLLTRRFNYRPSFAIDTTIITTVWRYCASNYISSILTLLPPTVLPLLIINHLGAESSAYYYIAMMIANLLYVIPTAMTRALFAEVSHDERTLNVNSKKAILGIGALLLPSIIFLFAAGGLVLSIFGAEFAQGKELLWLLSLSGITISINAVLNSLFQIRKDLGAIITMSAASASVTLLLSYALIPLGLAGIGTAWLCGTLTATIVGYVLYRRWPQAAWVLLDEYVHYRFVEAKLTMRSWFIHGFSRPAILFYPHKPTAMHILYPVCHALGLRITNDPRDEFVAAIAFEDVTVRQHYPVLQEISKTKNVINGECYDISKERVERVFAQVFGYESFVDPETFVGRCVKKSSANATHDGVIIECPQKRQEGYVYQKLIDSEVKERFADLRVLIYKNVIPLVSVKYKNPLDRFNDTVDSRIGSVEEYFSPQEVAKIFEFCREFGFDCGELDVLRDKTDGRIYIVDANITSSGPRVGKHMTPYCYYEVYLKKIVDAFASEFLPPSSFSAPTSTTAPASTLTLELERAKQ